MVLGGWARSVVQLDSLASTDAGDGRVLEDPPVKELHNVKRCADYRLVVAHGVDFWHWNVCSFEGPQNAEFSSHVVGGLRNEASRRLLAKNELLLVGIRDLIGRV